MAINLTETDTYTANVLVPEAGDGRTAASVVTPFQALTDRVKYLYTRLIKLAGFYSDGTFHLGLWSGVATAAAWNYLATAWVSAGDTSYVIVTIGADTLPHGATLTGFTVRVNPGVARATTGNRMQFEVYRINSSGTWALVGGTYDDGTTNAQTVTKSGMTEVIDRNTYSYALRVTSGNDGGTNLDTFNAAAIVRTL